MSLWHSLSGWRRSPSTSTGAGLRAERVPPQLGRTSSWRQGALCGAVPTPAPPLPTASLPRRAAPAGGEGAAQGRAERWPSVSDGCRIASGPTAAADWLGGRLAARAGGAAAGAGGSGGGGGGGGAAGGMDLFGDLPEPGSSAAGEDTAVWAGQLIATPLCLPCSALPQGGALPRLGPAGLGASPGLLRRGRGQGASPHRGAGAAPLGRSRSGGSGRSAGRQSAGRSGRSSRRPRAEELRGREREAGSVK